MAQDKKKKQAPKAPKWTSAFIWAAGQWAIAWFITEESLWRVIAGTAGGFIAGWCTAGLLGKFAKWGAGIYLMMVLGLLVGVAFSSGAVSGLDALFTWWKTKSFGINWEDLQEFILSGAVVPAIALGLFTGVYVRAHIPAGKKA